jgi:hypothetical protein
MVPMAATAKPVSSNPPPARDTPNKAKTQRGHFGSRMLIAVRVPPSERLVKMPTELLTIYAVNAATPASATA